MELEQSFDVQAPLERVWRMLVDVEQVAPCLPGASITGPAEDGGFLGAFAVKIGPTSAAYAGKLEMVEVDDTGHVARMHAHGNDRRGQGGATATIVSRLSEPSPGLTRVQVETDYRISGRLARFGRGGMIEDISEKLLRQFAANLQALLGSSEGDTPSADGGEATASGDSAADAEAPAGQPVDPADDGPPLYSASEEDPRDSPHASSATQAPPPGREAGTPPSPEQVFDAGNLIGGVLMDRIRRRALPLAGALLILIFLLRRRS